MLSVEFPVTRFQVTKYVTNYVVWQSCNDWHVHDEDLSASNINTCMNKGSPMVDPLTDALIATNMIRGIGKYRNNFPYTQPLPSSHYLFKTNNNVILSRGGMEFSNPYINNTSHTIGHIVIIIVFRTTLEMNNHGSVWRHTYYDVIDKKYSTIFQSRHILSLV